VPVEIYRRAMDVQHHLADAGSPEEKAELWPRVVAACQGYASYQRRTERDIPLVSCEPR
jgi:hypothetical protein